MNEYVFIVRLYDGTLYSAGHEFTLTVTDDDDPAVGAEQKLNIKEDDDGTGAFWKCVCRIRFFR